jgi:hypothetical protein
MIEALQLAADERTVTLKAFEAEISAIREFAARLHQDLEGFISGA